MAWILSLVLLAAVMGPLTDAAADRLALREAVPFIIWFAGLLVLAGVWYASRPKINVVVHGPQGQQAIVSAREAKRRIEEEGWSYDSQERS